MEVWARIYASYVQHVSPEDEGKGPISTTHFLFQGELSRMVEKCQYPNSERKSLPIIRNCSPPHTYTERLEAGWKTHEDSVLLPDPEYEPRENRPASTSSESDLGSGILQSTPGSIMVSKQKDLSTERERSDLEEFSLKDIHTYNIWVMWDIYTHMWVYICRERDRDRAERSFLKASAQ